METFGPYDCVDIQFSTQWTKFVLSGITTRTRMDDIDTSLRTHYPQLKLTQPPRWLTTEEQRVTKLASSVVIAIEGRHTLATLGTNALIVCNQDTTVRPYLSLRPDLQCGNCMQLGHTSGNCTNTTACGHCAKEHLTKNHTCPAENCRQGGRCTHTPFYCVNCKSALHKSFDGACPTRVAAKEKFHGRLGAGRS